MGRIPYGYKLSNGKGSNLIFNDEQQEVIQAIKIMRDDYNLSYRKISSLLNQYKISSSNLTRKGKQCEWHHRAVKLIYDRDYSNIITKGKNQ